MRISLATPKAIRYACLKFHYAKAVPSVSYGFNIFNDKDEWCGVICYGLGANNHIADPFNLYQGEVLELVRVALNGKQETTSQAVAMTLRELHKIAPHIKIIVSYADHRQNHVGTIYQATNWLYLGVIITTDTQYFFKGKWTHERTINGQKNKEELKKTLEKRENSNKHKYIFVFDKKIRKQWLKKAKEYPKNNK